MTVAELIQRLSRFDGGTEVMVLDAGNGCGYPRTLNLFEPPSISADDRENCPDCARLEEGAVVVTVGYGCY